MDQFSLHATNQHREHEELCLLLVGDIPEAEQGVRASK